MPQSIDQSSGLSSIVSRDFELVGIGIITDGDQLAIGSRDGVSKSKNGSFASNIPSLSMKSKSVEDVDFIGFRTVNLILLRLLDQIRDAGFHAPDPSVGKIGRQSCRQRL